MKDVLDLSSSIDLGAQANPGRRKEESVSFSLDELVARQSTLPPAPPAARAGAEEAAGSGLIDLSGLGDLPEVPTDGLFPLCPSAPALTAPALVQAPAAPDPSTKPLTRRPRGAALLGVAIAVVGLGIAAGMLGSAEARGAEAARGLARAALGVSTQVQSAAALEAAPTSTLPTSASVTPDSQPQAPAPASPTLARRQAPSAGTGGPSRPAPAAAPQRKADPCGGDLMCAMRRAASR